MKIYKPGVSDGGPTQLPPVPQSTGNKLGLKRSGVLVANTHVTHLAGITTVIDPLHATVFLTWGSTMYVFDRWSPNAEAFPNLKIRFI